MAKTESQKSFQKALYLSIAFVIVLVVANSLMKIVSHSMSALKANPAVGNPNAVVLSESEQETIKKKIAGFWQCNGVKCQKMPFLSVSDRFELKDNGIFWRVKHSMVITASRDSSEFTTIVTGYMNPYSKSKTCADSMEFQVHFIGEVVIAGKDTCYVQHERPSTDSTKSIMPNILRTPTKKKDEGMLDTVWNVVANRTAFSIDQRQYTAYDTTGPGLSRFFPQGATKLIGKISVQQCANSVSLETFSKEAIKKGFSGISVEKRTQYEILATINTYYRTMFAENLARRVTVYAKGSATVSLEVNSHGNVTAAKVVEAKPLNMRLNKDLEKEISTWVFPVCASQDAPVKALFSFEY